jgi:hypothetical protein
MSYQDATCPTIPTYITIIFSFLKTHVNLDVNIIYNTEHGEFCTLAYVIPPKHPTIFNNNCIWWWWKYQIVFVTRK